MALKNSTETMSMPFLKLSPLTIPNGEATCNNVSNAITIQKQEYIHGTKYARQIFKQAMILTFD
jgi:hypothetical protein